MSAFTHLPLGQRIPAGLHGVSCSLPTMRDVIGYEEKHPEVVAQLTSGYPRFVVHPFSRQAAAHLVRTQPGLAGHSLWLTSSVRAAERLRIHLASPAVRLLADGPLTGVAFPEDAGLSSRAKTFLQHTGMFLSSREAEDYLVRVGELKAVHPEPGFDGYAAGCVKGNVARAVGAPAAVSDVFLAPSGMNAIYGAFRAVSDIQRPRGRTRWLQLGWLYLDTIAILREFTGRPAQDYLVQDDVFDLEALRRLFAEQGDRIAGLITEVPTNPLIQTPDLAAIRDLCREHGVLLVLDPTIASPLNIDVLACSDVLVNSLTKYAASEGDVIMGSVIVNPAGPHAADFRARLPGELEPVYSRDLDRLAAQIGDTADVIGRINRNAPAVVDFLRAHPRVKAVYWSHHPASRDNYLKITRDPGALGSMVSFEVDMPLARFYDRVRLPKGPSFGMKNTLLCPFIYIAHYDLVTSEAGRARLAAAGISPELLRLSIGCEPADDIIAALAEALA